MNPKPIIQSKTLWLNLILLTLLSGLPALLDSVDPDWIPLSLQVPIVTVLNALMRLVTSRPVSLTGSE